jgi:hypothetical protein
LEFALNNASPALNIRPCRPSWFSRFIVKTRPLGGGKFVLPHKPWAWEGLLVELDGCIARILQDQIRIVDKRRLLGKMGVIDEQLWHPVLLEMLA